MKNNVSIILPETKRYLTILHGEMVCSVIDSPFTSMKMDIYHQLRNLRISADKVGEQVITKFSDLTENQAAAIRKDFEERLFTVEYLNGKEWDKIYKSLLAEIAATKPVKVKPTKPTEPTEPTNPVDDPIEAIKAANPEPTNILPGGEEAINDTEEPEIVSVKPTKPTKPVVKKESKPVKKDGKK